MFPKFFFICLVLSLIQVIVSDTLLLKSNRFWCQEDETCDNNVLHENSVSEEMSPKVVRIAELHTLNFNKLLKSNNIDLPTLNDHLLTLDTIFIKAGYEQPKKYNTNYNLIKKIILREYETKILAHNSVIDSTIIGMLKAFEKSKITIHQANQIILIVIKNLCNCKRILRK